MLTGIKYEVYGMIIFTRHEAGKYAERFLHVIWYDKKITIQSQCSDREVDIKGKDLVMVVSELIPSVVLYFYTRTGKVKTPKKFVLPSSECQEYNDRNYEVVLMVSSSQFVPFNNLPGIVQHEVFTMIFNYLK